MLKKTIAFFLSVLMTLGSISVVSASANSGVLVFGGSLDDVFNSIVETADGNFVAVGESKSTDSDMQGLDKGGNYDAIIVKYDANGNVLWKKSFGGSSHDTFTSVTTTSDGNLVAVGYSSSTDGDMQGLGLNQGIPDAIIVKYDSGGNVLWKKSFGGNNFDYYHSVASTPDGNLVAVGESNSTYGDMQGLNKGGSDAIIVKYDKNGNVLWKKSFGGSNPDSFNSVTLTPDGNFVAVGESSSTNGDMQGLNKSSSDAIIVKYDPNGNILWKKSFGGSNGDYYYSVASTPDGNLVAVGNSNSTNSDMAELNKGGSDAIIVKYDPNGNVLWKKSFGGSSIDVYYSVASAPDGNLVAVGYSISTNGDMQGLNKGDYDAIIVKYDSSGNVLWKKSFGGSKYDIYYSVASAPDGNLVAVGYSDSTNGDMQGLNKGYDDAIIVKYDPNGNIVPFADSAPEPASFSANITDLTNQDVIVTINYPEQAVVRQYKIDDGNWLDYTGPVVMTQNGTIYARGQAANGMWSEISTYVVSNIVDEEDPVGEGPGENNPEEEGPDAGNPIGSHPISCNTDGTCNILSGMNKIHKVKYILAQRAESVDIATLVPSNYNSISTLWN